MKKIIAIAILVLLVVTLTGCARGKLSENDIILKEMDNALFFQVSKENSGHVIVDKATCVMYWKSAGSYNYGTLTLLVNPDGTPRIWEG